MENPLRIPSCWKTCVTPGAHCAILSLECVVATRVWNPVSQFLVASELLQIVNIASKGLSLK